MAKSSTKEERAAATSKPAAKKAGLGSTKPAKSAPPPKPDAAAAPVAEPATVVAVAEATVPNQPAPLPATPVSPVFIRSAPAQPSDIKPMLALAVEHGLFVIVAAAASVGEIQAFARYEALPLPRLVNAPGYLDARHGGGELSLYTAYVPWPSMPSGAVQVGCISSSGRKPVLTLESVPYTSLEPQALLELLKRFGNALKPAFDAALPAQHPLRRILSPAPQVRAAPAPSMHGTFDGLIDGLAHGWVWNPAKPGERYTVEVLHEGEVVARGLANRFRDDLQANGIGDGQYHFRLSLSYELFDGQAHELSVRVMDTAVELSGSPRSVVFEATRPAHVDWISRREGLQLLQPLAERAEVRDARALQALLQAFRKASLQQETWMLEDARSRYERLLGILGPNALCHCKVAETYLLDRRPEQALGAYQAALRIDPQLVWAHLGLGNVFRLQGRALEARDAYRTALTVAPGNLAARRRLDQVRVDALTVQARQVAAGGDKPAALALLKAVVLEQPDNEAACAELDELLCEALAQKSPGNGGSAPPLVSQTARSRRLLDAVLDEAERRLQPVGHYWPH